LLRRLLLPIQGQLRRLLLPTSGALLCGLLLPPQGLPLRQ
jgi:hypothetical protein